MEESTQTKWNEHFQNRHHFKWTLAHIDNIGKYTLCGANKHVNCPTVIIEPERRSISHFFLLFLLSNLYFGVEGSECDWIILLEWDYGQYTCTHNELEQLDYVIFSIFFSRNMYEKNSFVENFTISVNILNISLTQTGGMNHLCACLYCAFKWMCHGFWNEAW